MARIVERIDEDTYQFSTSQDPKVEKHTIQQMEQFIQMCNDAIASQETEKVKWETMISEAEAL